MDSNLASQSPDTSDIRPSFRKPSNDASHRKYRRHSPLSGSSSPSSSGGLKRDRSYSPDVSQGYISKAADSARKERRIDGERDSVRDYDRAHGRRGSETRGTSERHSYGRNRDYHGRSDEYSYNHRHGGNDDREYQRYSSRSGRDSKSGTRSEYSRRDDGYEKSSREDRWNADKGIRDKVFDETSRKRKEMEKDRDKDSGNRDRYKNVDRDVCLERSKNGDWHSNTNMDIDEEKPRDREGMMDVGRDKGRNRDESREHARDIEHKKGRDDVKGRDKDDFGDRDESRNRARDKYKSFEKDSDTYKDDKAQHRKRDDVRERDQYKEKHIRELDRHSKTEPKGSSSYREKDKKERDRYRDGVEGNARKGQENEHGSDRVSRNARDGKHQSDLYDRDGRRNQPISENSGQFQGKGALSIDDRKSLPVVASVRDETIDESSYVPDPVSLLGPVSESLDNFSLHPGARHSSEIGRSDILSSDRVPIPAPINRPGPIESPMSKLLPAGIVDDVRSAGDQLPPITEPWGLPSLSFDCPNFASEQGKWQMWETPQLGQSEIGPFLSSDWENDLMRPLPEKAVQPPFKSENHIPFVFSQQTTHGIHNQGVDPVSSSNSLWLNNPAFGSTVSSWEGHDHNQLPSNHANGVTQEPTGVGYNSVILANGHSYEQSANSFWSKSQSIDDKVENNWSVETSATSSWPSATKPLTRPKHIGGIYTDPGVQSVWSYN